MHAMETFNQLDYASRLLVSFRHGVSMSSYEELSLQQENCSCISATWIH
jgi:hypothetical protein